ncbi:hypothetical protein [Dasania marina]|nr:hypothetical protein [Dasania marina]
MNTISSAGKPTFITWSHWVCTSASWQDYFRGEDDDSATFS